MDKQSYGHAYAAPHRGLINLVIKISANSRRLICCKLIASSLWFVPLSPIPAMAEDPLQFDSSGAMHEHLEKSAKERCRKKGGRWYGLKQSRGRKSGCVFRMKDAGASCDDGARCESNICLEPELRCDGKVVSSNENVVVDGQRCKFVGKCHHESTSPRGCFSMMRNGTPLEICVD